MASRQQTQPEGNLPPGLSAPAQRALAQAGYSRLNQLTKVSEAELKRLHGIGPKALDQLRRALSAQELSFANEEQQGG